MSKRTLPVGSLIAGPEDTTKRRLGPVDNFSPLLVVVIIDEVEISKVEVVTDPSSIA
jgi:hypothetical protein